MNQEIMNELLGRIKNNELEDDTDLTLYIQVASRLKALGDSSAFDEIGTICKRPEFAGRLDEILTERCRQGIWDINAQLGEELGFTIIECQDFWLCYEFAKNTGLFSESLHPWFESWENEANEAEIDEETREILEDYLTTYPIPEEYQIGVVAAPVTEFMSDALETIASQIPVPSIHATWQKPVQSAFYSPKQWAERYQISPLLVACDDGKIPDRILQEHNNIFCNVDTPAGTLHILQVLQSDGRFILKINNPAVDTVRAGLIPAFTDEEHSGRWWIDLRDYDTKYWSEILDSPIVVMQRGRFVLTLQR